MANTEESRAYLEELKKRARESHVYSEHQLIGLMLAEILQDEEHKSLYIKLAKKYDSDMLLQLAKDIADRPRVANRGAYFMRLLHHGKEDLDHKK